MAWTTLYNQEIGAKNWQETNEGKTISDTLDTKIYSKKGREPEDKLSPKEHETYRSEADIFTKNTTNAIFQNHQEKLVWHKGEVNKEGSQVTEICPSQRGE